MHQIIKDMLVSHPGFATPNCSLIAECVANCQQCAMACFICADACLSEKDVESLRHCIRLDQDCAVLCEAGSRLLLRAREAGDFSLLFRQIDLMMKACEACAEECERHARHHEHCRLCAEACRRCIDSCRKLTDARTVAAA